MSFNQLTPPESHFTDEQLIAYLDGVLPDQTRVALDAALAVDAILGARLAALTVDTGVIADAFAPLLLNAPKVVLPSNQLPRSDGETSMTALPLTLKPGARISERPRAPWKAWAIAASVCLGLFLSFAAIRTNMSPTPQAHGIDPWRMAVVEYQRLYVRETLAGGAPDAQTIAQQVASVSTYSGLQLSATSIELPDLSFRRAQTLGINGQPLVQMAYVTRTGDPVALCFTRQTAAAAAPTHAILISELNTVSWNDGQFGFVLVGRVESAILLEAARVAARQLKTARDEGSKQI
jgi:anti-sigma factor RsiW